MRYSFPLSALVALLALGCSSQGPQTNPVLAANLRKAPTTVQVGEATLQLSAYLWRDFMPGPEMLAANGSPLMGSFAIRTQSPAIHPPVTFDALWVVNGADIWTAKLENNPLADPAPGTIPKIARNGPRWATGITVDVIAQVGLGNGTKKLIRTSVTIVRTE